MEKLPSPLNPIVLIYTGKIPSMKNSLRVIQNKRTKRVMGVRRSKSVEKTMMAFSNRILQQMQKQGWTPIEEPNPVACYIELGVYIAAKSKTGLPNSDLDNSYTTIQETLQGVVIGNDRQIVDFHVTRRAFNNPNIPPYSRVFLWALDRERVASDPLYAFHEFLVFRKQFLSDKSDTDLIRYAYTTPTKPVKTD